MLKIVDNVMLTVNFGASEGHSEASEVERECDVGRLLQLAPTGAGCGVAMDAAHDDHGAFRKGARKESGRGRREWKNRGRVGVKKIWAGTRNSEISTGGS